MSIVTLLGKHIELSHVWCVTDPEIHWADAFDDHVGTPDRIIFTAQSILDGNKVEFIRKFPWADPRAMDKFFDDERMTRAFKEHLLRLDKKWERFSGVSAEDFIKDQKTLRAFNCADAMAMCRHIIPLKDFFAEHARLLELWGHHKEVGKVT